MTVRRWTFAAASLLIALAAAARGEPSVRIHGATTSVPEGNQGVITQISFRIQLSAPAPNGANGTYQTADGTATANSDYLAANGTFTIPDNGTLSNETI